MGAPGALLHEVNLANTTGRSGSGKDPRARRENWPSSDSTSPGPGLDLNMDVVREPLMTRMHILTPQSPIGRSGWGREQNASRDWVMPSEGFGTERQSYLNQCSLRLAI
jgi:hypothetical protein